jgi:hypothetical protein
MIKIVVTRPKDMKFDDFKNDVIQWCISNLGPVSPRGQHNQKKRKTWKIKFSDSNYRSIDVMLRKQCPASTLLILKYGND